MNLFITSLVFFLFAIQLLQAQSDAAKYEGATYKESEVPAYLLPDVLQTFEGKQVRSIKDWERKRRPEVLQFFAENIYGKIPQPVDPIVKSFSIEREDPEYLEGLCTRRDVKITFKNKLGEVEMPMVLFIPNEGTVPYPAIYWLNLTDIRRERFQLDGPQDFGKTKNQVPLKQLMLRGIALISIDAEALGSRSKSREEILNGGILDLFFQPDQTNTREEEWGLISVWAYAMISGMDYIVTDKAINAGQVAAMGSSIGGKTAIWAAAQDQRIGMVLSATSGHGGDALWKRQVGETMDNMLEWLPRWLCRNAKKYERKIDELPVDQHLLLACLAPRPLYVSTAVHDLWADQKGQWLGAYHAASVYNLYEGKITFQSEDQPPINQPIIKNAIGYHVRSGFHGLKLYDWERFMEFIEYHFMKIPVRSVHDIYYREGKLVDHYPNRN